MDEVGKAIQMLTDYNSCHSPCWVELLGVLVVQPLKNPCFLILDAKILKLAQAFHGFCSEKACQISQVFSLQPIERVSCKQKQKKGVGERKMK